MVFCCLLLVYYDGKWPGCKILTQWVVIRVHLPFYTCTPLSDTCTPLSNLQYVNAALPHSYFIYCIKILSIIYTCQRLIKARL